MCVFSENNRSGTRRLPWLRAWRQASRGEFGTCKTTVPALLEKSRAAGPQWREKFDFQRKELGVARKPNYKFDRQQRDKAKAEKKAAKEERKAELKEEANPESPEDPAAAEV